MRPHFAVRRYYSSGVMIRTWVLWSIRLCNSLDDSAATIRHWRIVAARQVDSLDRHVSSDKYNGNNRSATNRRRDNDW
jgi:hypothetical protein